MLVKEITLEWLKEKNACIDGVAWFKNQSKTEPMDVLSALIEDEELDWANWFIVRVMDRPQYLAYAIFAAEQVLDIFESSFPDDKRPRQAIEAARAVLENDTAETVAAAWASRDSAWAAWAAADASRAAAAEAARAAVDAAAASWASAGDAWAAWAATDASWASAGDAGAAMLLKILRHGISLLEKEKSCVR